jgi:hypothetical protein
MAKSLMEIGPEQPLMSTSTDYTQDYQPPLPVMTQAQSPRLNYEDQIAEILPAKKKIAYELRKQSRKTQRSTELTHSSYIDELKSSKDKKRIKAKPAAKTNIHKKKAPDANN